MTVPDLQVGQEQFSAARRRGLVSGFRKRVLHKLFGRQGTSVVRGGFAVTNDHFGQQLAVQFDLNNTLGFSPASKYPPILIMFPIVRRPFSQVSIRISVLCQGSRPGKLTFPLPSPADESQRIKYSLDDSLRTPVSYSWNASFGRQLPGGLFFEASYIGRAARKLLSQRDIMALNNLVDPKSQTDWYAAMGALTDLRAKNTPIGSVQPIPYFQNLFPATLGDTLVGDRR